MARPREFDEDEVLDKAMEVFWAHGYEATSIADLMEATGLAKGSIYKGFGDKKSLFLRGLERYLAHGRQSLRGTVEGVPDAKQALRDWLMGIVEMATARGLRRGCMAVNCTVELAPHHPDVRRRLKQQEKKVEEIYAALLRRGVSQGAFRSDVDPEAGARWLTTIVDGIQVRGKLGLTREDAAEAVDMALGALEVR